MNETITLEKINLYGEKVTREITNGDIVLIKNKSGFYEFHGLTKNGKAVLWDGTCASFEEISNLRF